MVTGRSPLPPAAVRALGTPLSYTLAVTFALRRPSSSAPRAGASLTTYATTYELIAGGTQRV